MARANVADASFCLDASSAENTTKMTAPAAYAHRLGHEIGNQPGHETGESKVTPLFPTCEFPAPLPPPQPVPQPAQPRDSGAPIAPLTPSERLEPLLHRAVPAMIALFLLTLFGVAAQIAMQSYAKVVPEALAEGESVQRGADPSEVFAVKSNGCGQAGCLFRDHFSSVPAGCSRDNRHTRLDDSGLLRGHGPDSGTQVIFVFPGDVRNHRDQRADRIRGIQTSAEAHLYNCNVGARFGDTVECDRGGKLEKGGSGGIVHSADPLCGPNHCFFRDHVAVKPDALAEIV